MPKRVKAERRAGRIKKKIAKAEKKGKKKREDKLKKKLVKVEGRIEKQQKRRAIRQTNLKKFNKGMKKAVVASANAIKGGAKWVNANKKAIKDASNFIGEVAVAVNPELEDKVKATQDKLDKGLNAIDKVSKGIATAEDINDLRIMIKEKKNIKAIMEKSAKTLESAGETLGGDKGEKMKILAKEIRENKQYTEDMMKAVKDMIKAFEKRDVGGVIKAGKTLGKGAVEGVKKGIKAKEALF